MSEQPSVIDELKAFDDTLFKNLEAFQLYIEDNKNCTNEYLRTTLDKEEMKKYEAMFPCARWSARQRRIISLLESHPELRSVHPDILRTRIDRFLTTKQ